MMFQSVLLALLASGVAANVSRELEGYVAISTYTPMAMMTDIAAVDRDQLRMDLEVEQKHMNFGLIVYTEGGYSMNYAKLRLTGLTSTASFNAGTRVSGIAYDKTNTTGRLLEAVSWEFDASDPGEKVIKVLYDTYNDATNYVKCQVGGLYRLQLAKKDGCFAETGTIKLMHPDLTVSTYNYTYTLREDNVNGRTLKFMSTEAGKKMKDCETCQYYDDYQKFLDYYGDTDYADKWVTAAFNGSNTNFKSKMGNADFSTVIYRAAHAQAARKGTAMMSVWMRVVRAMEEAIYACNTRCTDTACDNNSVGIWDSAVAYYVGSLVPSKGDGVMVYHYANRLGGEFKTAGPNRDATTGTAFVNLEILTAFTRGQSLMKNRQCDSLREVKNSIVKMMKIPLVQGVLENAWIRKYDNPVTEENIYSVNLEGATYTAALLPYLHACDKDSANFVYETMKVGSQASKVDFKKLKRTIERNYQCLGLVCEDIGGLYGDNGYEQDASPCEGSGASSSSSDSHPGRAAFFSLVATFTALTLVVWIVRRKKHRKMREEKASMHNIAAVREIS